MKYVVWITLIMAVLMIIGILLTGCETPIVNWNVKDRVDEIHRTDTGECHFDGFDAICLIPKRVEVRIEVVRDNPDNLARIETLEAELEAERNKPPRVEYIQLPGEKEIVEVRVEVPVPEIQIVEVVKIVKERVEVPFTVIEIVYVDREVPGPERIVEVPGPERIVYVDREVIKEVEKIVKVPVETIKIVEKRVEVPVVTVKEVEKVVKEVVQVPFTGKIRMSDAWYGGCAGTCHAVIKDGVLQWTQYTDEDGNVYKDND